MSPHTKDLLLSLNISPDEISDPKSLCVDVTNKGRWGNGNVETRISSEEEIPYALGLIRQALEVQLGGDSE